MANCTAAERETPEVLFEAAIASPDFGSTAAWAARSLLTFAVRKQFPPMFRVWPCLRSYDYQAFVTPAGIVLVILRDTLNNVITGSPKAKRLDWSLSGLAPESVGATLEGLRERFGVRDDGAVFALPLRTAVSGAAEVCRRWATGDTEVLASQLAWNIERHERHLGLHGPEPRPMRPTGEGPSLTRPAACVWGYIRDKVAMPTYDDITAALQMGRSTVSHALRELRARGLIPPRSGKRD